MPHQGVLTKLPNVPASKLTTECFGALMRLEDLRSFASPPMMLTGTGTLTFPTRSAGEFTASRRKIFIHALLHGVRHWAQLSIHLRQKGYKQDWMHDFISSGVIR